MSEILPFEGANYKRVIEHFTGMLNTPAKLDNVLHCLQTGTGPGIIMQQEKKSFLLCPASGSLSLELSQHYNVAFRADPLSAFQKIQKDHPSPISKDSVCNFTL